MEVHTSSSPLGERMSVGQVRGCNSSIMNFLGLIIAVTTFLVIGIFHPIVIKSEYYFGVKCWWAFLISGIAFIVASLFTDNEILSPVLGVVGCSCLWSILEVFEQRQRVKKGWFPMNPKRKHEYENVKIK